jgi:hypothetical protein
MMKDERVARCCSLNNTPGWNDKNYAMIETSPLTRYHMPGNCTIYQAMHASTETAMKHFTDVSTN